MSRENFDGDGAFEASVASAIDFAHTAGAKLRRDFVGARRVPAAIAIDACHYSAGKDPAEGIVWMSDCFSRSRTILRKSVFPG